MENPDSSERISGRRAGGGRAAGSVVGTGFGPDPQQHAAQDHGDAQPLPHAHLEGEDAQVGVGFAEIFGREARHAIADQEHGGDLRLLALPARVQPQEGEQHQPFEQELVDLRGGARCWCRFAGRPWPRAVGVRRPAPELAVDEVADAAGAQPQRNAGRDEVHQLPEGLVAAAREPLCDTITPIRPPWKLMPPCHTYRISSGLAR